MYNPFYPNFNPYIRPEQPVDTNTIQRIQTNTYSPNVQCYFVNDSQELQNIRTIPNTFYIGINQKSKEIYVRSWNNDGLIDFNTYTLAENKQEESELKTIMNKLNMIEEKLNARNDTNDYATNDDRANAKQSNDGFVQSNDARKNTRATVSNNSKLGEV